MFRCHESFTPFTAATKRNSRAYPREREVFDLLVSGLSVKVIAEQLELSHKTVHVHRANVLGKLQCENTIDLVHYALEHNLISR